MDLSTGLIKINVCGAVVFLLYFYTQTCGWQIAGVSFFVLVPLAKVIIDRMTIPVRTTYEHGYPFKKLLKNFVKFNYGLWCVLFVELIRRVVIGSAFNGIISIILMAVFLLAYVFSEATGVCCTNTKNYKNGTIGFLMFEWILISIAFLAGSSLVGRLPK